MFVSKLVLYFFTAIALLTVLLPLIKKDHWIFRSWDYPRIQKLVIASLAFTAWLVFFPATGLWIDWTLIALLGLSVIHLVYLILPFTFLGKTMIDKIPPQEKTLSILVSNVYQKNKNYDKLLGLVKKRDPDIVFLVETNKKWLNAVKSLREDYPHYIEVPRENTYGLLFYSKLPVVQHEINYLVDPGVPSIIADVKYEGRKVRIFGLHPSPPVPHENSYSTHRDAEILMVGKMAKQYRGPCLVIGDLNDVAWSYTTTLFLKTSGLLDPRLGRGIYSTYHAKYFFARWPLDHYFLSGHFRLVQMKVEKHIGSDHFPISICVALASKDDSEKITADQKEKQLVEEKIEAGLEDDPK